MGQRVSLITLGVDDVARSRAFYEALGWHGQEVEATVFFQAGGVVIVLWGRGDLAADAGIEDTGIERLGGIALAHNVRTPDQQGILMENACTSLDVGCGMDRK